LKEWIKEYKLYIGLILAALFVLAVYFLSPFPNSSPNTTAIENASKELPENKQQLEPTPEKAHAKIMVDIKGSIEKPGVYEALEGERVIDLITRAGGLTDQADETKINLAMVVEDEMVLYIPKIGEDTPSDIPSMPLTKSEGGKININKAEASELETLPGIGPSKSAAIIEYRKTNGKFNSIEDIQSISGIGEKTFEKLKDKITTD
jgi:competence protein ComEA